MARPLARLTWKTDLLPTDQTQSLLAILIFSSTVIVRTSGIVPTREAIGTRRPSANMTKVSPVTHSLKSDIIGRLSVLDSTPRLS